MTALIATALTVLTDIALAVGALSLLCLVLVITGLAFTVAGDMRLARQRKQNLKAATEVGDDVIDMLAQWDDAAFNRGLKRLMRETDRG